jgi:intracellular sulfur oxidation DsrE/DsrF family protein
MMPGSDPQKVLQTLIDVVDNPNLELVEKLHAAGVRFYVCGQSLAFGKIARSELASPVEVALSAMTMLTVLQSEGYALLP